MKIIDIIFLGTLGLVLVSVIAIAIPRFAEKESDCKKQNGLLVKTTDGWLCVKLDRLS